MLFTYMNIDKVHIRKKVFLTPISFSLWKALQWFVADTKQELFHFAIQEDSLNRQFFSFSCSTKQS